MYFAKKLKRPHYGSVVTDHVNVRALLHNNCPIMIMVLW